MITQAHTEILRQGSNRPPVVIAAGDARVQSDTGAYSLDLANMVESPLHLRILARAGSYAELTWPEPTTTVGVQFWGDGNDGHARILVDGEEVWQGSTQGESVTFEGYIEIVGLPASAHTVRVEATGTPGGNGGTDVTVAAFGWGAVGEATPHKVYLPFVTN